MQSRYLSAMKKMQAGVAFLMNHPDRTRETDPKHLRAGINSAMVDSSALASLLIKKGVISEKEYLTALAEGAEAEAGAYEKRVQDIYGPSVKLGGTLE